ncbi:hypothetical protein AV521_13785 [Streptomyces sp. IMTB 2501]|uniref:hypothetical protein n=1 Tax=Streptomyces sp. IMTB 2501 TaxID=1776340 RepID=UPI00096D0E95|nr:hypothetical protein [Streptomyces sp. IMTB 2501]OLZ71038.1 hypothetical protein AV521_13785 [Streptomyces sp. IMTB 2501]
MAGSSSGIVAGLTAAALGTVGFLALQAQATVPAGLGGRAGASASPSTTATSTPSYDPTSTALPGGSGAGERVVYSLGANRVWLVSRTNQLERTFRVSPGSVDPSPGTYWVTSRSNAITGTDGTPIEHVVRFTEVDGLAVGFSAAVGSAAHSAGDPVVRSGGIRETRLNGDAMWDFATIGVRVMVIR